MVHVIGVLTVVIIIALGAGWQTNKLQGVPWYAYLGGIMNVVIIYAVVRTIPQIGVGNATTAMIVTDSNRIDDRQPRGFWHEAV